MINLSPVVLKKLIVPIGILVFIIMLAFIGGRFALGKIIELNGELSVLSVQDSKLVNKLTVLQEFSLNGDSVASSIAKAIPRENPSVLAIAHIREIAGRNGLFASQISVGAGISTEGEISHVDVNFDIEGSLESTTGFFSDLTKTAPYGTVDSVSLSRSGNTVFSAVTYRVYYSTLPSTITSVSQDLPEFTQDEIDIIGTLTGLISPNFVEVTPNAPGVNNNPFGL